MGIVDAWNASARTRGTAADRGRRVRRIVRRVGSNAPYQRWRELWDGSLYRIHNCDIGVRFCREWRG